MITNAHMHIHAYTPIHTQYYNNFGMPDLQTTEIEQPELRNLRGKQKGLIQLSDGFRKPYLQPNMVIWVGSVCRLNICVLPSCTPAGSSQNKHYGCVSEKTVHNSLKIRSDSESAPQNYLRHNLSTWQSLPCSVSRSVPRGLLEIYNILCMHTLLCKSIGK